MRLSRGERRAGGAVGAGGRRPGWVRALGIVVAGAVASAGVAARARAFGLEDVAKRAEQLAGKPYQDPHGEVPDWLLQISYDQWRDIRFRPEQALWRGQRSNFEIQFFHPGLFYDRTIAGVIVRKK